MSFFECAKGCILLMPKKIHVACPVLTIRATWILPCNAAILLFIDQIARDWNTMTSRKDDNLGKEYMNHHEWREIVPKKWPCVHIVGIAVLHFLFFS